MQPPIDFLQFTNCSQVDDEPLATELSTAVSPGTFVAASPRDVRCRLEDHGRS